MLVVAEAQDSGVAKAVAASQLYECVPVPRREWDDSAGFLDLSAYALPEDRARLEGGGSLQAMAGSYLAYAAAGALLKWVLAASAAKPAHALSSERMRAWVVWESLLGLVACTSLFAWRCTPCPPLCPHPTQPLPCHRHLQQHSGLVLVAHSLAVRQLSSITHMAIDQATAEALELVQPIRVGGAKPCGASLFR